MRFIERTGVEASEAMDALDMQERECESPNARTDPLKRAYLSVVAGTKNDYV